MLSNKNKKENLRIWLVECEKIIVLHVRHALINKSVPSSAKQQREITTFTVLIIQPLIFSYVYLYYFDSAQTNPVAGLFVNIAK